MCVHFCRDVHSNGSDCRRHSCHSLHSTQLKTYVGSSVGRPDHPVCGNSLSIPLNSVVAVFSSQWTNCATKTLGRNHFHAVPEDKLHHCLSGFDIVVGGYCGSGRFVKQEQWER